MSEITEISVIILHELGHLTGSKFHCNPRTAVAIPGDHPLSASTAGDLVAVVLGFLFGGLFGSWLLWVLEELFADTSGPPVDCCQYGLEGNFRWRLWAALGCPPPHVYDVYESDLAGYRFSWPIDTPHSWTFSFADTCALSGAANMDGEIDAYMAPGSGGSYQWAIPSSCSSETDSGGYQSWSGS